jgi:hypothetical protein
MGRKIPTVWVSAWGSERVAEVQVAGEAEGAVRLDSAAWLGWLEAATTRSFAYPIYDKQAGYIRGWMTVRKEGRARGSQYWVAYRRQEGRVRKLYLGRSAQVSEERLASSAEHFLAREAGGQDSSATMEGRR